MSSVEKQQFQNKSGGFLGVVVIGPKGVETGVPVEPDGYVWLSEEEQILTANAPRRPEDNPFSSQEIRAFNPETGEHETITVTPLVPSSEERYVPSRGRYVPGTLTPAQDTAEAAAAARAEEPTTVLAEQRNAETRHEEVSLMGTAAMPGTPSPPPVPRRAAAAAQAADEAQGTDPTPEAPGAPQEPPSAAEEAPVTEETAAVDPAVGEETGAAAHPTAPATEGEYKAGEEVGTPDAPAQPAPYTPPAE